MTKQEILSLTHKKITREKALELYNSEFWMSGEWVPVELAYLQYHQDRLIMPFEVWWHAVDWTLGYSTLNIFPINDRHKQTVAHKFLSWRGHI